MLTRLWDLKYCDEHTCTTYTIPNDTLTRLRTARLVERCVCQPTDDGHCSVWYVKDGVPWASVLRVAPELA